PSPTAVITASPTSSPTPPIAPPTTGRPYDADDLLVAMRASRRPGGVPDELEVPAIAAGLAAQLWTWSGDPYPTLVVGGSCGPQRCTVEVSGAPSGAAGADLYVYSVARDTRQVVIEGTDLRGYPAVLDPIIDRVVRDALDPALLDGLILTGAAWQLPPATGQLLAAYRSGGEEGSPGLDVLVDLTTGAVLEVRAP
ncbi:MAG TPA: hypothetical protein VFM19_01675, partial [Candidatus Limnocylindria bacterium]|nr:hypothetical protein [Candidatus Limnocylindria bacterium]